MREYILSPEVAITTVARLALLPTICLGPIAFYLLRKRAMNQVYPYFTIASKRENSEKILRERVSPQFSYLISKSKLSGISLSIVPAISTLPVSAALNWKGKKIVAISEKTIHSLDDEELRAVLAHEIGHIARRDSLRKTLATTYKTAFVFDPIAHIVEAAIYRDGELYADEYSAKITGNPAALASALIKIHESAQGVPSTVPSMAALSLLLKDHDFGLFSKQPSLVSRIKRLLEMERLIQSDSFLQNSS
jgi:heat shock protein HtpX